MKINTIDGRAVSENIGSAYDYIEYVILKSEYENSDGYDCWMFIEENEGVDVLLSKIIALLYSHRLLRNTSHICGSLTDSAIEMINELIQELKEKYDIDFDLGLFDYY